MASAAFACSNSIALVSLLSFIIFRLSFVQPTIFFWPDSKFYFLHRPPGTPLPDIFRMRELRPEVRVSFVGFAKAGQPFGVESLDHCAVCLYLVVIAFCPRSFVQAIADKRLDERGRIANMKVKGCAVHKSQE